MIGIKYISQKFIPVKNLKAANTKKQDFHAGVFSK
jgi:hypothetical protein